MNAMTIIGGILILVLCILIIVCVALMEPQTGLGTIAGQGGDSFFNQNSGRTRDAMLTRAVCIFGGALVLITLLVLLFA